MIKFKYNFLESRQFAQFHVHLIPRPPPPAKKNHIILPTLTAKGDVMNFDNICYNYYGKKIYDLFKNIQNIREKISWTLIGHCNECENWQLQNY